MSRGSIRVPLAVDAQLRVGVGPAALPVRAVALCALVSPLAYLLLAAQLPGLWGIGCACFLLALAAMCGTPERQGVWLGTHLLYAQAWRVMPNILVAGQPRRARVERLRDGVRVAPERPPLPRMLRRTAAARLVTTIPRVVASGAGVLHLDPSGPCAVLTLNGPAVSVASDDYMEWCLRVVAWLSAQRCPAQLVTAMAHHDSERVGRAFDARVAAWPATPLRDLERVVATGLSDRTIGLRHFVVLAPGAAAPDGMPHRISPWRAARAVCATEEDVIRALQTAVRTAASFAVDVAVADRDDISALVSASALGCHSVFGGDGILHAGGQHHVVLTAVALPGSIDAGCVVDAMLRARAAGAVSLHLLPVTAATAQRHLHRRSSMLRYAAQRGPDPVEAQVALQDTAEATAALAARELVPVRVALTVTVSHHDRRAAAALRCCRCSPSPPAAPHCAAA